ncbi:RNF157 [Cordylochernes scorpioides]|uniref:RNF157 n=1 Tax=Cordylochernes scorpioides TaxID=51811 RepID=A0ABY6LFK9_9ARAC|nr:RNF157 [Cordylochernes scorpioides]
MSWVMSDTGPSTKTPDGSFYPTLIRKELLDGLSPDSPAPHAYNIEFIFDTDIRCAITIYYFCTEEITQNGVM